VRSDQQGFRNLLVAAERVEGWLHRFAERHGALTWQAEPDQVAVRARDGAVALCSVPFPPLEPRPGALAEGLAEHVLADRVVGVLLVRRGGHAAGVFVGARLTSSKVGSTYVQGRTAAGGQSQQRFARRRDGQAKVAFAAGADVAVRVLLPALADLDAVLLGGDRVAVTASLSDPRLARLTPLVREPFLDVPDPRLRVLQDCPRQFRAVRIRLYAPPDGPDPDPAQT
jgi:hypothetical protein